MKILALLPAAATVLALGACTTDYLDRKDTVAFSAGDAVQTNIVAQVPDPWPPHARLRDIASNGERMQRSVERYRTYDPKPVQPQIIINTNGASLGR